MKDNNLEIRRFEKNDKDAVLDLHKRALEKHDKISAGTFNDFDDIESVYIEPGGDFVVGTIDGVIVAIGGLKKFSDKVGEIKRMRVEPVLHRRGFGQAILDRLEHRALELGFNCLELDTGADQEPAQKLYEKNGYEEYKREDVDGIPCIFYRKML